MSETDQTQLVFVAGLSGSGKSTVMAALEDLSFYCLDNLPAQLVPQFLQLCQKATPAIDKIAIAVDTREERFLHSFPNVVERIRAEGAQVEVIFIDCANETLEVRYRETRRVHPLAPEGSVGLGIERERKLLVDAARLADFTVDSTTLNVHQLKDMIVRRVTGKARSTVINLVSFGFRYGTPDMRFLPNPYFEPKLEAHSGLDAMVSEYVLESERGRAFAARLRDFIGYLLPMYDEEGKAYVTIGIGCTGGRHRSVAMVEGLAGWLRELGREVNVEHRDVERT